MRNHTNVLFGKHQLQSHFDDLRDILCMLDGGVMEIFIRGLIEKVLLRRFCWCQTDLLIGGEIRRVTGALKETLPLLRQCSGKRL